jgi:hypothetical protein
MGKCTDIFCQQLLTLVEKVMCENELKPQSLRFKFEPKRLEYRREILGTWLGHYY